MKPMTLPLITDFKKEYKFIWALTTDKLNSARTMSLPLAMQKALYGVVKNPVFQIYVSQLADVVTLPDDELETEPLEQGGVEFKLPKKVKLADMTVEYLDDSLESVYNFHKTWFSLLRGGNTTAINAPRQFTLNGIYMTFEDTMTVSEYIALSKTANLGNDYLNLADISIPYSTKPTGITKWPGLYPVKITRSPASHSGEGLSKVTVTYSRWPNLYTKHSAIETYDPNKNQWSRYSFGYTGGTA